MQSKWMIQHKFFCPNWGVGYKKMLRDSLCVFHNGRISCKKKYINIENPMKVQPSI
jgi:hypothetical protein